MKETPLRGHHLLLLALIALVILAVLGGPGVSFLILAGLLPFTLFLFFTQERLLRATKEVVARYLRRA